MHDDDLIELRWGEFRELVDDHFQMLYASGSQELCRAPIIARLFFAQDANHAFTHKKEIFAAVAARHHFHLQVPAWVPCLPIVLEEIDAMKNSENNVDYLVGLHADSLKWQGWNYRVHPSFFDHCCGIMASEHAPDELRKDPALQQVFTAKKLAGLDQDLCWHSVEQVIQQREWAMDLIRQGQETENDDWVRAGNEDLAAANQIYPTLAAPTNVVFRCFR